MGFWLGSGQDGLDLVMAGRVGYDVGRDLACVQGFRKVVLTFGRAVV
jgi:hypothetical protein